MILEALACGRGNCPCAASTSRGKGLTHCPAHPDRTPSLNVDESNGSTLVKCHAGCEQSAVVDALKERGLWRQAEINSPATTYRQPVARYAYQKADGSPAYEILRFEPKDFRASRPVPETERLLYRLPEVLNAVSRKRTVYICEGEKDVDALRSIGVVATCNPFGAGKFLERYAQSLIGATVVICADADEVGRAHAKDVAQKLSVGARSVKILEFPRKDAADWIASGGDRMALEVIVDDLPEWSNGDRVIWSAKDLGREYREILQKRIDGDPEYLGWPTGFSSLDKALRYRPGDVWMLAASTGTGKSALLQSLQRRATVPNLLFSLEMTRTQLIDRLIAAEAKVDGWKVSRGMLDADERQRVLAELDRFERSDMQIVDNAGMTTATIENILRVARIRFGIRLVFLDYIGLLVDKDGESRYVQMSNISHALARIAKATGVCLVSASQVSRKGDRKSGEPPFMDEMRDSGVLEEDAAVVLALGRAEGSENAKLAIRKNRHGTVYTMDLLFDQYTTQFIDPSEASMKKAEARSGTTREAEETLPF